MTKPIFIVYETVVASLKTSGKLNGRPQITFEDTCITIPPSTVRYLFSIPTQFCIDIEEPASYRLRGINTNDYIHLHDVRENYHYFLHEKLQTFIRNNPTRQDVIEFFEKRFS